MEKTIMDKEAIIEALVSIDPVYRHMMNEASDLEKRFDKMVAELSNDQRNLVWDFVMKCEYISQRKMYLACQYMDFTYIEQIVRLYFPMTILKEKPRQKK